MDEFVRKLVPLLKKGDIIIDGGNSQYTDTQRWCKELAPTGILYVGMGVSLLLTNEAMILGRLCFSPFPFSFCQFPRYAPWSVLIRYVKTKVSLISVVQLKQYFVKYLLCTAQRPPVIFTRRDLYHCFCTLWKNIWQTKARWRYLRIHGHLAVLN